nr:LOW QUALITY PROTEIN: protein nervous wreck-like [Lepeophtheirus salmonis]
MAQPPPRKGAFSKLCQNLNKEQHSKLQIKIQQEGDLLEDIRTFVKQKASIEKHYADGMLKLSTTYSNRRIASLVDINDEMSSSSNNKLEEKNVYTVWKHLLDENEKIAKARLAAVQVLQEEVEKDAKVLRNSKQSHAKKSLERLGIVQKEVQQTVAEVDRTKKAYYDDESSAHDVRDKAKDAEERSKGRKKDVMSLFHSKSTLRKHAGKLSIKQEECDIRSTGTRNDYILSLASANAHQDFYFKQDLQESIRNSELNFYEKISTYLNTVARAEVLTTTAVLSSFSNIRDQAECITRDYNYNCYMQAYPCLREHTNYEFEACDGDSTTIITPSEHDGGYSLNYEARQNASKLNQASKTIKAYNKRIKACHHHKTKGLKQEPNDTGGPDLNTKIIELQIAIRNAEMEKAKAESRLAKLREGGISVDEYIDASVYAPTPQESEYEKPQQVKQATEVEDNNQKQISQTNENEDWPTSDTNEQKTMDNDSLHKYEESNEIGADTGVAETTVDKSQGANEDWANWEANPQQQYDYSQSWADFDKSQESSTPQQLQEEEKVYDTSPVPEPNTTPTYQNNEHMGTAVVLYDFGGQAADELTVREQEIIQILYSESDEEGWVMAQNSQGQKGYVPQNYLEINDAPTENGVRQEEKQDAVPVKHEFIDPNPLQQVPDAPTNESYEYSQKETPVSIFSTNDTQPYNKVSDMPDQSEDESSEDTTSSDGPPSELPPLHHCLNLALIRKPQGHPQWQSVSGVVEYCKALYDYEATGSDEITFIEGQIIRILNKDPNGINDGWWLGEPYDGNGKSGLFPSIVVEECLENGESAEESAESDSSVGSPDSSMAPPCFTPPGMESNKKMVPSQPSIEVQEINNEKDVNVERKEDPVNQQAPLMPPIMVTNPTPIDPIQSESCCKEEQKKPTVSFSVETPDFEMNISEEAHNIYNKTEPATNPPPIPTIAIVEPPVPPPLPSPDTSLKSMEIIVTAPTPARVQSPDHSHNNQNKRNIIEELKQHPAFKERKESADKNSQLESVEDDKKPESVEDESNLESAENNSKSESHKVSQERKIEEIQKKIEPAVQEMEQKALCVAKEAKKNAIPIITTNSPDSSSDDDSEIIETTKANKDSSSSESESGPDQISSSEGEEEDKKPKQSESVINPLPPDELEMRQLKKLDKLKESTA